MRTTQGQTVIHFEPRFETWRREARRLIRRGVDPSGVQWSPDFHGGGESLALPDSDTEISVRVPPSFLEKARYVACARDPQRWALMYRVLYRLALEDADLLQNDHDADVRRFVFLERAVRREVHKMLAFTHFRTLVLPDESRDRTETRSVAWCRPEHPVLELIAPAFARRMGRRPWSILTPDACLHSDDGEITFVPGLPLSAFFLREGFEDVAIAHLRARRGETAEEIHDHAMHAPIMVVGDQPEAGDDGELAPFAGPARFVLDDVLAGAGLDRGKIHLTTAVKHPKPVAPAAAAEVRVPKSPTLTEIKAARPELEEEIRRVRPRAILALGRAAAYAVLGREVKIGEERGEIRHERGSTKVIVSWHPSAVLRTWSDDERQERQDDLVRDFSRAAAVAGIEERRGA